jgi:hypothetical protein
LFEWAAELTSTDIVRESGLRLAQMMGEPSLLAGRS